jgi:heterotetrameric sarcosine oxidase gamma subunit
VFVAETVTPRGAFEQHLRDLAPNGNANDLRVEERLDLEIATVMSRGDDRALAAKIHGEFGLPLPSTPRRVSNGVKALVGVGPGVWFAVFQGAGPLMASELASSLAGLASVADQTSAYAVLRISGAFARELLSRGAFIDFDPSVFGPGSAAVTTISHIGVTIWQIDETPTFEIALFRSFADSFWHWMMATSTALGVGLVRDGRSAPI